MRSPLQQFEAKVSGGEELITLRDVVALRLQLLLVFAIPARRTRVCAALVTATRMVHASKAFSAWLSNASSRTRSERVARLVGRCVGKAVRVLFDRLCMRADRRG